MNTPNQNQPDALPTETNALAKTQQEPPDAKLHAMSFASGRSLVVSEHPGEEERVQISAPDGQLLVSLRLTPDGPVLSLSGVALEIAAAKNIALKCNALAIQTLGDLSIESRGSLYERVAGSAIREVGKMSIERAGEVKIEASPGGVRIEANDDVDVKGERVRLNSDDPPMPLTWEEYKARQLNQQNEKQETPGFDVPELWPRAESGVPER